MAKKTDPSLDHLLFVRGGGLLQAHYPKRGAGELDLLFLPGVPEPAQNIGDPEFADLLVADGACIWVTKDGRMEDGKVHPAIKLVRGEADVRMPEAAGETPPVEPAIIPEETRGAAKAIAAALDAERASPPSPVPSSSLGDMITSAAAGVAETNPSEEKAHVS